MRHFVKYDLIPILSMLAVCAFPCVFLYARNAGEVPPSAMVPFLTVFSVNALAFFLLALIFLRNASRAALWTDAAMLVVINFCLLAEQVKKLLPLVRDRYLLALLLLLLLALFALLLWKKPDLRTGCLLVLIGFGTMTAVNGVQAIPAIISSHEIRQEFGQEGAGGEFDLSVVTFTETARPNVYYYLFDEYGGYDNLQYYFDYDDSGFLTEMADRGASVAYHSKNTEALYTNTLVTNLVNLNYVADYLDSEFRKEQLRHNCQMFRMFAANGYQIDLANHVDYLGTEGCRVLTVHQTRRTISEYLMRNSLYYKSDRLRTLLDRFYTMDYGANYRSGLDNVLEAGLHAWQETGNAPTLTVCYLQFPHTPFMVGPNGEELPFANGWNYLDPSLYLGQVEYAGNYILSVLDEIRANDPDALVIFQSDHGYRYPIHMVEAGAMETYDPYEDNPYMQNILNCVWYGGEQFEIEDQTGLNTLRLVFSQVFGADLPPVEPIENFDYGFMDEH